jgi:hypothetical protein
MFDFPRIATDGLVKIDDFGMRVGKGSEKLKQVFGVALQFEGTMREGADDGRGRGIPRDSPVSMGLDVLCRFRSADGEVEIADRSGSFVVGESGKES